jgi:hypothetical protein
VLHVLRRLASFAVAASVALTGLAALAPAAQASTEESQFVSMTNGARSNKGLRSYSVASDLVAVARRHAQKMASQHTIFHNPNLGSDVSGWQAVGENVGMGGSASSIHQAFMNSTAHRANILDSDFTQVGIGTAFDEKGVLYVTEVFRKPYGAAPAPAPAPVKTAPAKPRPVYRAATPRTVSRPATTRTVSRPAARPVAKPVAKAAPPKADPRALLNARLAAARAVAARSARQGSVDSAVTYLEVMTTLA